MVAVGAFGAAGIIKKNKSYLQTYITLLICLAILKIILGILTFAMYPVVEKEMKDRLSTWYNDSENYEKNIDEVQEMFECCSAFGLAEWDVKKLPDSCCPVSPQDCNKDTAYQTPCYSAIVKQVEKKFKVIGGLCLTILCLEIMCCILAAIVIYNFARQVNPPEPTIDEAPPTSAT
ncbi:tetraspanin-9-like [Cimex lectularius]|uniref:Tetraspanin n=1 Tax=Cimex lectularius TaxID=79782 RepID=A0A8I6SV28_CIMLE|nr:tetraspanin-9-like [Cimex lectularius]